MDGKVKGIIVAVIIVAIGLTGFCGYGFISQKLIANEGIEHLQQKEYQQAYEKFHKASGKFTLIWTKQKKDVLFYEGESLYRLERYDDAIQIYKKLAEKGESRGYSFEAFCYMGKGKTQTALDVCDQGIADLPEAGDIYCTKYAILAKQKKYQEGLKVLEKALDQENLEDKQEVLFQRISAYEAMFDYDTAYQYAKKYVKAYPKDEKGKKELTFLETR